MEEKVIGLNVGSGERKFSSGPAVQWINIDKESRPGEEPDLVADGANLGTIPNGSVDLYVLHHCLEHEGCGEGDGLIREAHRVLRPGGSLLVFVPDLYALATRWLGGQLDTQIYVTNLYGAFRGDDSSRHRWGFDAGSLLYTLQSPAKWRAVKPFDWRTIPGASIARDWWILGAEAIK
jgi:SAM-dependent methyltransferase